MNTLPELCNYLKFCPVCQEYSRPIIYCTPSDLFNFYSQKTDGNKLELTIRNADHLMRFIFDFSKPEVNSYEYECEYQNITHTFYIYASAHCLLCKSNTRAKFIIDSSIRYIPMIEIKYDQFHLMADSKGFNISIKHSNPLFLAVSRYTTQEDGKPLDINKIFYIPMIELDFSDIPALIKKINILLMLS